MFSLHLRPHVLRVNEQLRVKLCDTALSRDLFPADYHCLGDNENRPIKWMALESIARKEYSSASDVVSRWFAFKLSHNNQFLFDNKQKLYKRNGSCVKLGSSCSCARFKHSTLFVLHVPPLGNHVAFFYY